MIEAHERRQLDRARAGIEPAGTRLAEDDHRIHPAMGTMVTPGRIEESGSLRVCSLPLVGQQLMSMQLDPTVRSTLSISSEIPRTIWDHQAAESAYKVSKREAEDRIRQVEFQKGRIADTRARLEARRQAREDLQIKSGQPRR